jgi:DNA-binding response OmpR family regulator
MIELTKKEFDLLEYFMVHPNQVISQELLLERVWGFDFNGTSNVVEVYIGYLRRKLEAHNKKRLIHTVRSIGYILRLK